MPTEVTNQFLTEWSAIATIIATFFAFAGLTYSIYRYVHRARFLVTVIHKRIKRGEVASLITHSGIDELRILKEKSLIEIRNEKGILSKAVNGKSRKIIANNNYCELAFLLQNVGNKESGKLKLVIRFDTPKVQITDFHTEAFIIEHFYNSRPNEIISDILKSRNMDETILEYYEHIRMTGAYLSLESTFSGGAFDMIVLGLSIPEDVDSFLSLIRIECQNVLHKRQILAQKFIVQHS